MKNLKEFIALIHRYENISDKDIHEALKSLPNNSLDIMARLTGFGSISTCTLCSKINTFNCYGCVYDVYRIKKKFIRSSGYKPCASMGPKERNLITNANHTYADLWDIYDVLDQSYIQFPELVDLIQKACKARAQYMRYVLGQLDMGNHPCLTPSPQ